MERTLTLKDVSGQEMSVVLNVSTYRHPNIIINFLRSEKTLGNYINSEFDKNGWKIIDATNLTTAKTKLYEYLIGDKKADNIYLNSHGGVSTNKKLDEEGNYIIITKDEEESEEEYKTEDNSGAKLGNDKSDWVMSNEIEFYRHEKKKLKLLKKDIENIENLIEIGKKVNIGKNLIFGSCNTAMDDRFGQNLVELIPETIDIFMNNNTTTSYSLNDKISFENFTKNAQTSAGTLGWDRFQKEKEKRIYKNLIINKYGVKVVQ